MKPVRLIFLAILFYFLSGCENVDVVETKIEYKEKIVVSSEITAGSIFSGVTFTRTLPIGEPYDIKDNHSRLGIAISFVVALIIIFFISNPFSGLIYSQMILSIQLPITIFVQVWLTSSAKVMGKYKNSSMNAIMLYTIGAIVTALNIALFVSFFIK